MKPITEPDLKNEDPTYWEKVLSSHNLGMKRGAGKWMSYGQNFERDDKSQLPDSEGRRVLPHKNLGQIEKDGFGK